MVCAIQLEWIFLQRITNNMGDAFAGVENMLWKTFLPRLFFRKSKSLTPIVGTLGMVPVNKSGIGLLNTMTSAKQVSKFEMVKHGVNLIYDGGR